MFKLFLEKYLAQRAKNKQKIRQSMCNQAWVEHFLGHLEIATNIFGEAEVIDHEIYPQCRYLFSDRGIFHADHLHRTSNSGYARRVTEDNLKHCEKHHWSDDASQCHRILGELDSEGGNHASACTPYDTALKIARSISRRSVLIEALLARGSWQAKYMKDVQAAFSDLNEALGYAVEGGYRIYEADIRVALAWAWLAEGSKQSAESSKQKATAEAERALRMSEEMGYYWGKVDAEEVLKEIRQQMTENDLSFRAAFCAARNLVLATMRLLAPLEVTKNLLSVICYLSSNARSHNGLFNRQQIRSNVIDHSHLYA